MSCHELQWLLADPYTRNPPADTGWQDGGCPGLPDWGCSCPIYSPPLVGRLLEAAAPPRGRGGISSGVYSSAGGEGLVPPRGRAGLSLPCCQLGLGVPWGFLGCLTPPSPPLHRSPSCFSCPASPSRLGALCDGHQVGLSGGKGIPQQFEKGKMLLQGSAPVPASPRPALTSLPKRHPEG